MRPFAGRGPAARAARLEAAEPRSGSKWESFWDHRISMEASDRTRALQAAIFVRLHLALVSLNWLPRALCRGFLRLQREQHAHVSGSCFIARVAALHSPGYPPGFSPRGWG